MHLSESRKLQTKLSKKLNDCMTLLHFRSHHPLSCKEGIIYTQALRYNMSISEDHILQSELNNLTCILLSRAYPLHLIIKSIKKALTYTRNNLLSNEHHRKKKNILPVVTTLSDISKLFTATVHKNWHTIANDTIISTIWPFKPLSVCSKSNSIHKDLLYSAQTCGSTRQDS